MDLVSQRACIKIDSNKTFLCTKQLHLEQAIFLGVEPWRQVELRCLHQRACGVILPAMILAREKLRCATAFSDHGIRTMSADIMKSTKFKVLSKDDEELDASKGERVVVAWPVELALVTHKEPGLSFGQ